MTERLSSLHDPYNGCVDLQHNYSDNQDWWLFISGIPGLIACQWGVAARNGEQKKKNNNNWKAGEKEREKWENTFSSPRPQAVFSCSLFFTPSPLSERQACVAGVRRGRERGAPYQKGGYPPSFLARTSSFSRALNPLYLPLRTPASQATKRLEKAKSLKARVWSLDLPFIIAKFIYFLL